MLTFYKDAALTIPVTASSPLWVLSPLAGSSKILSLWLADTYHTVLELPAAIGDTSITVLDVTMLPASGSIALGGIAVTYTDIDGNRLTGVPATGVGSISLPLDFGTPVYPVLTYQGAAGLIVSPQSSSVRLALRAAGGSRFGIPGSPALFSLQSASSIGSNNLPAILAQVDVQIITPAGELAELTDWSIISSAFAIPELQLDGLVAAAPGHVYRADQSLEQIFRVFPASRQVPAQMPGFTWSSYRWRDRQASNGHTVVPTIWDLDVEAIGLEKFVSGIGYGADLQLIDIEKSASPDTPHSIYPRVGKGAYFIGPDRYYMPAESSRMEVFPVLSDGQILTLADTPKSQTPVFVGNYTIDDQQEYRRNIFYDYQVGAFEHTGNYQFLLSRKLRQITLNNAFTLQTLFVGTAPDSSSGTFSIPTFPVGQILRVFLGAYGSYTEQNVTDWNYDANSGKLSITFPVNSTDRDIYVNATPAVAVIYEIDTNNTGDILLTAADLNPAFAGIARGFLYLDHRRRRVESIELFADKPRIITPQSYAMVANLLSFGPVFYENDYAMLLANACGRSSSNPVPAAELDLIVAPDFQGSINYQDPATVKLMTGGDGTATFLYLPPSTYGLYLALTSVSGATLTLPAPVAIQQLWNVDDGWLVRLYQVNNNNPFYGMVGGNQAAGAITWSQSGIAGTTSYRTNGQRIMWKHNSQPTSPVHALDAQGKDYTDPAFSGYVTHLVYASAIPASSAIGSYFLAYIGQVSISVMSPDTGVVSNSILLRLETPPDASDVAVSDYLRPNIGRLNINRLGGQVMLPSMVNLPRY